MFLKPTEILGSLKFRLAAIFVAGSLATLIAATGYLYYALNQEIHTLDQRILEGRVGEVAKVLGRREWDRASLEEEIFNEMLGTSGMPLWIRIGSDQGIEMETPGMSKILPPGSFQGIYRKVPRHRKFRLAERREGAYLVQGALEVTEEEHMILAYRKRLAITLVMGAGACALIGWWAAHRGLVPLRGIAESTRGITAQRLRHRLEPGDVPQELRDLVQALNAMLDRLDHAFDRLSRFSADLAHELRTPITNLMGEAEVVLSRERPTEEYRQVLESSMEEFRRLSSLITRMLFLARTEDPGAAITLVEIDSERLLGHVLAYFEAAAEEQAVNLVGAASGNLRGDSELLRQALANLLSNALAATPEGGTIRVRVEGSDLRSSLTVEDTGRGIPPEELPRVLDRFFRTKESFAHKRPGTGLGLAIVQSIARLHGGGMTVQSTPGKGTTVRIEFPTPPALRT